MSNDKTDGKVALKVDQILVPRELPKEFVPVPEWGDGGVWMSVMTGTQRDAWEAAISADKSNARVKLIIHSAVDPHGAPLFLEAHMVALSQQNSIVLYRLAAAALRLNKIGTKDLEETKGN